MMKRLVIALSLAAAGASLLPVLGGLAVLPGYPQDIPLRLKGRSSWRQLQRGYQSGEVSSFTDNKRITILWAASFKVNQPVPPPGPSLGSVEDDPTEYQLQTFGLRHYPTDVCALDSDRILISAVSITGETIIERWTFTWPATMPGPQPPPNGPVSIVLPVRSGVLQLYRADIAGKRFVRSIAPVLRGSSPVQSALVQFDDSGDVYLLDVSTGALSLAASPTNGLAQLGVIPGLDSPRLNMCVPRSRAGYGYLYMFGSARNAIYTAAWPDVPAILDTNKDGVLDGFIVIPSADYWGGSGSWTDGSVYDE